MLVQERELATAMAAARAAEYRSLAEEAEAARSAPDRERGKALAGKGLTTGNLLDEYCLNES